MLDFLCHILNILIFHTYLNLILEKPLHPHCKLAFDFLLLYIYLLSTYGVYLLLDLCYILVLITYFFLHYHILHLPSNFPFFLIYIFHHFVPFFLSYYPILFVLNYSLVLLSNLLAIHILHHIVYALCIHNAIPFLSFHLSYNMFYTNLLLHVLLFHPFRFLLYFYEIGLHNYLNIFHQLHSLFQNLLILHT